MHHITLRESSVSTRKKRRCTLNHGAPEMSLLYFSSANTNLIKELICRRVIFWNYLVLLGRLFKHAEGSHVFWSLWRWDLLMDLIISSPQVLVSNGSAEVQAGKGALVFTVALRSPQLKLSLSLYFIENSAKTLCWCITVGRIFCSLRAQVLSYCVFSK